MLHGQQAAIWKFGCLDYITFLAQLYLKVLGFEYFTKTKLFFTFSPYRCIFFASTALADGSILNTAFCIYAQKKSALPPKEYYETHSCGFLLHTALQSKRGESWGKKILKFLKIVLLFLQAFVIQLGPWFLLSFCGRTNTFQSRLKFKSHYARHYKLIKAIDI